MSSDKNNSVEQSGASDDSIQRVHAHLQHTKPEKAVGYSSFPLVLLGILCSLVFFGSIYLAHYSAHFDPMIFNENQKPHSGAAEVVTVTPAQLGKKVFNQICITCHQATGQGIPGVFPPLAGSDWAQGSEERIIRIVLHGLNGKVTVSGKDFENAMASLGGTLKDEQIANVLTYVRQEWGNKAPAVSAETVAKIRSENASRTTPWTAPELLKIGN